ncbi:MAG: prepilin-type N-terminal cleavage/methylation domain-containing protein [Phycisphaerales bacterium]|jgi:prepilin-type N-terminal cleavage/methylation domain-containing protein|nr:prepilin-type N-terminal cleavage/methylation domain-containing protein [Phycisphaerales bacterium]
MLSQGKNTRGNRRRVQATRRGFTLIETALATIIVGVGVLSIVAAQQAFHKQNTWSSHASIAARLGNEIREMTLNLPSHDPVTGTAAWGPEENELWVVDYDDLDDFDGDGGGMVFGSAYDNGPINARREVIPNMDGWSQTIRIANVDSYDITSAVDDGASEMVSVEVVVSFQEDESSDAMEVTRVGWISPR